MGLGPMDMLHVLASMCRFDDGSLFVVALVSAFLMLATSGRQTPGRCARCGQRNRQEAIYCAQCGRKLPD